MDFEKRALQLAILAGGFVPVLAGGAGVLAGLGMIPHAAGDASLDSHFRYLSGLLLAIGVAFWSAVPDIERQGSRVRLLTAIVVTGGLARALGVLHEAPGGAMRLALVMELGVTPLICLWQARIAGRTNRPVRSPAAGRAGGLQPRPGQGR
jgi:hypothetical protein